MLLLFCCVSRLLVAKSLGATHTVLSTRGSDPKEVASNIAQVVKYKGGLDFSIDTTGATVAAGVTAPSCTNS